MGHIVQFLVQHGYLLLFFWLLAEQAAVPLPALPMLLAGGALARAGKMDPLAVIASGMAACMIADNIWFQLGRRRGAKVLRFVCRLALEPDSCVRQTENAFLKYGLRSLLVAKFIPGLNAVAAPLAGSSGAGLARFLLFDGLGAIIWLSSFTFLGYLFADQLETAAAYAMRTGSGFALLVLGLLAAWIAWKFVQRRRFLRKLAGARITAEELRDLLEAGEGAMIVDVRSGLANDADTIPGSLRISVEELATRHAAIPRDREIILFCS